MPRICTDCQKTLIRIHRQPWMRFIPGSKRYACRQCGQTYLLILKCWLLKGPRYPQATSNSGGS